MISINGKEVVDYYIEDVNPNDYPDFCDAHLCGGVFLDGTPLTDAEMEQLNEKYPELVWEMAYESLH